jgi:asparagine synthase (glutamine-hydrolysing)
MCSVFSLLNNYNYQAFSQTFVETQFNKGGTLTKKGEIKMVGHKIIMGCNENDSPIGEIQPIIYNDIVLICDGEIFNYKELYEDMGITSPLTSRSCEVIIYLYMKYGIEYTLQVIDGEYAFILLDNSVHSDNYNLFVVRDPYGVKPLFILYPEKNKSIDEKKRIIGFSSEKKVLDDFFDNLENTEYKKEKDNDRYKNKEKLKYYLKDFQPGTYSSYYLSSKVFSSWTVDKKFERYHSNAFNTLMYVSSSHYNIDKLFNDLREYLIESIQKRCDIIRQQKQKIACLLSGDNESRLMLYHIKNYCYLFRVDTPIEIVTYSVGLEGSDELKNAREFAYQYGTTHNEIHYVPNNEADSETNNEFDLLGKYIRETSNIIESVLEVNLQNTGVKTPALVPDFPYGKSGEGIPLNNTVCGPGATDGVLEVKTLFVSYGLKELSGINITNTKEPIEFDRNVREQLNNIHNTNLLRLNKSLYSYGIEITAPYLDRAFVQNYLSIPTQIRCREVKNLPQN